MKLKRLIYILFFVFFLLPSVAFGGIRSRDYLGGARYCDMILATHPQGWGAGFFATEFNIGNETAISCVRQMIQRGLSADFRIQLVWRATHNYDSKARAEAVAEARNWEKLAVEFPHVRIRLSGACEHRLDLNTARKLGNDVSNAAPHTTYVNSYISGGAQVPGFVNEVHGGNPGKPRGKYIESTDGTNLFDIDAALWQKTFCDDPNNEMCFGHFPRDNGRQKGTTLPPKKRPDNAFPAIEYMRSAIRVMQPKGVTPKFSKKYSALKYPFVWKTDSEDKVGQSDSRANYPVLLAPLSWKGPVAAFDSNGNKVCSLGRVTPDYQINGKAVATRHYSGRSGCGRTGRQIGELAKRKTGNEFVIFCHGSSCLGAGSGAFRFNYYYEG